MTIERDPINHNPIVMTPDGGYVVLDKPKEVEPQTIDTAGGRLTHVGGGEGVVMPGQEPEEEFGHHLSVRFAKLGESTIEHY